MTICVELVDNPYDIHVGTGLLERADELVPLREHGEQVVVVTQPAISRLHLSPLHAALERTGRRVSVVEVPDGEVAKQPENLVALWDRLAELAVGRQDTLVALGGGVVGDLTGFAAASWNRGIDVVQVPTTLLGQVDSAIGGKTGVNLRAGKNLVGAFHQPQVVLCDIGTLSTLPPRELTAGLGEVVKYGFIRDGEVLDLLDGRSSQDVAGDEALLTELVRRSAAVKAAVVAADERESGERAHLNFGHTFGHAVEALTGYTQVLHGEAVAIGMAMALRLGVEVGLTRRDLVERNDDVCGHLGLPTTAPALDREQVWRTMARDKKALRGIRFVLVRDIGEVEVGHVDPAAVDRAIDLVTS